MIKCNNNSDTVVVVLHEIYGINDHIKTACQRLSGLGVDVVCPDLLNRGRTYSYDREQFAYKNFIKNIGFERAAEQVKKYVEGIGRRYRVVYVLGYSIGATIAWLCSGEPGLCDGVVGYYGSRIRDYAGITPRCPVLLFFPAREKAFDVDGLIRCLSIKSGVLVKKLPGSHGFADPFCSAFLRESYDKANEETALFIRQIQYAPPTCF
ncbi:MAG: dienelactone hydrolase family protein [Bacillota bacterium]